MRAAAEAGESAGSAAEEAVAGFEPGDGLSQNAPRIPAEESKTESK